MFMCAGATPKLKSGLMPPVPKLKTSSSKLSRSKTLDTAPLLLDVQSPAKIFSSLLGLLKRTEDSTIEHAIITVNELVFSFLNS